MRYLFPMNETPTRPYAEIRRTAPRRADPGAALPHLRMAADALTRLIDESLASTVLDEGTSLRVPGRPPGSRRTPSVRDWPGRLASPAMPTIPAR